MLAHLEVRVGVGVAISDRHGGISGAPWASLNLADHVGDDDAAVARNRQRLRDALGPGAGPLVTMRQVHGADVAVVDGVPDEPPAADAMVSSTRGITLTVLVADCTPVLLSDRRGGVIAAVHVGRRGLAARVLPAALDVMSAMGARHDRIYAVVGPAICPEHYEVPAEMRRDVDNAAPGSAATTSTGAPALDIRAGLLRQMYDAGIHRLMTMPQCTAETDDYFSHRRDGVTGRFAGAVWMLP